MSTDRQLKHDQLQQAQPRPHPPTKTGVFIAGLSGAVGSLLAKGLIARHTTVSGIVRRPAQRDEWSAHGVDARVGDLASIDRQGFARLLKDTGTGVVVYAAGSNGGAREVTRAIDLEALATLVQAAVAADVTRFILVSVFPEAWRERALSDDEEYYFVAKKQADIQLSKSPLDWVILRPSLLTDGAATGTIDLGPAQTHGEISRADVATTLMELLDTPRVTRRILELTNGQTPIREAVRRLD